MKTILASSICKAGKKLIDAPKVVPILGILVMSCTGWSPSATAGNDVSVAGNYTLSIAGLPFAKGSLSMVTKGDLYAARAKIATWGVAKIIVESQSYVESSGRLGRRMVRPAKYALDSRTKKFDTNVRMRLSGGAIRDLSARPPLSKQADRVPVKSRHKSNVLDPLSAAIVPYRMKNGEIGKDACNKTIPIFDGWSRFDVKLHFRRFADVRTEAYTGKAAVCGARWVPLAGHRPNKKTVIYLRENKDLEAWLVPVPGSNFLIPYRMSIKTKSGNLVIQNKRLVVNAKGRKHAARK